MEPQVTPLGDDLYLIDAGMFDDTERLACYLFDTPERVVIECGPSLTIGHLYDALEAVGVDDVATMVVTHIHLDHAGGAGHFAQRFPGARIGVHRAGARHLEDPTRLWDSATRVYGAEGMRTKWGPMEPIPAERLLLLDEGDRVPLGGGRHLEVLYTPGHAKHHVVFFDPDGGGAFIGDSVGIAFPHGHLVQPVTPPPDLDPELVVTQLRRIAALEPSFLGFAHFGPDRRPQETLAEAERRLAGWVEFVTALGAVDDDTAAAELQEWVLEGYRKEGFSEETIAVYDKNTYWPMQAAGIRLWRSRLERS